MTWTSEELAIVPEFLDMWKDFSDDEINTMLEKHVPREVRQAFIDADGDEDELVKGYLCCVLIKRMVDDGSYEDS